MSEQDSVWFRLGYTLEQARLRSSGSRARLRSPQERQSARKVADPPRPRPVEGPEADAADEGAELPGGLGGLAVFLKGASPTGEPWEAVIAAAGTALVGRVLAKLPRKHRLGPLRLLRAAGAGAGAALVRELLRPMTSGQPVATTFAERARRAALSGSARGLLYGALVEPRIPGPPIVRGAAYGAIEHLVSPLGGLTALAGPAAPHRSLPFISQLFEDLEPEEQTLMDHILFGIAVAALYGAAPPEIEEDDEEDED